MEEVEEYLDKLKSTANVIQTQIIQGNDDSTWMILCISYQRIINFYISNDAQSSIERVL